MIQNCNLRANHHGLTLDQIATMIIGNMDKNADGNMTVEEIDTEFVTNYDHDGKLFKCFCSTSETKFTTLQSIDINSYRNKCFSKDVVP